MNLNVLIVGQSNARYFAEGNAASLQDAVQHLLGFDGVQDRVTLIADDQTTFPGVSLLPSNSGVSMLDGSPGKWQAGRFEAAMLRHLDLQPPDVKAAPTLILWMHNESDSANPAMTRDAWVDAVQYKIGHIRSTLGQAPATTPVLFVPVPYVRTAQSDSAMQAIKDGMAGLIRDPAFNAVQGPQSGDLDMNGDRLDDGTSPYGWLHMSASDRAVMTTRLAQAIAHQFAADARPGSPVSTSGGHLDLASPYAWVAIPVEGRPDQVMVAVQTIAAALDPSTALPTGWTVRSNGTDVAATASQVVARDRILLTFAAPLPEHATLYYGEGEGRLAVDGGPGQGHALRDVVGTPVIAPLDGLVIGGAAAVLPGLPREHPTPGRVNWILPDGSMGTAEAPAYDGPADYLRSQFIMAAPAGVQIIADTPSIMLVGGAGMDALQVMSGDNILDGQGGSNWLVGGNGEGHDTFYLDARLAEPTWDTLVNFHPGDAVTLWGFDPSAATYRWLDRADGAVGNTGPTLSISMHGHGVDTQVTFAGLSLETVGRFNISTGTQAAGNYLMVRDLG